MVRVARRASNIPRLSLRACLSVRFQGLTSPPEYQPSAPSRLRPAKRAALCLPDPCGLGSDSHDGKVFSGKLLKSLTQTGSDEADPNVFGTHHVPMMISCQMGPFWQKARSFIYLQSEFASCLAKLCLLLPPPCLWTD